MRITNILWDIDGEDREDAEASLPTEITIDEKTVDEEDIADFLSDEYGWCVKGFCVEHAREE